MSKSSFYIEASMTPIFSLKGARVFVAGHTGMVGSAIVRRLAREECTILTAPHKELDLTRQAETEDWILHSKPDVIVLAAGKVGGIAANSALPVEFLANNLAIALNVI